MRPLTIPLDDPQAEALEAIAREHGAPDAATFVRAQLEEFIASYRDKGVSDEVRGHLAASIRENLGLLKRLAQ